MQTLLMIACLSASGAIADDDLAPSLDWVRSEGFRMGYNYKAPLDWYARAKACGMNGIISRLEIANDPSGDEELPENAGGDARSCWEMVRPSSRLAKQHGLRFLYMLNLGGSRGNIDDGYRDNPRRFNNGRLFSPIDEIYWTRVVEDRFLRVADMLDGDEYQIDGFLIDPEMYAENGAVPADIDYGDYALTEFAAASGEALEFEGLTIPERAKLIDDRGLTEDLYDFEFERIRDLAIATREKLQARVPDAIMGTFLWHDHLWFKAVVAGLSTPRVPCFVGPESTYPGSYDDQFLAHRDNIREQAGVPIFCVPGLRYGYEDGDAREEFLKVLPGNLYARSTATEGYWFWALTRLGETDEERKPFIDVLSQVNGELDQLETLLGAGLRWLKPGGRWAVITFHSGEDRPVKRRFTELSRDCICPPAQPICTCTHRAQLRLPRPWSFAASESELNTNPRARSARLRVAERLAPTEPADAC